MAIYTEFENENRFRNFPFSEGSVLTDTNGMILDVSMFLDAMLYPQSPSGNVRLSAIDFETNTLEISDDTGVIGTGELGDDITVRTTDGAIIGKILTDNLESTASGRREFLDVYFASSCVIAFTPSGVMGIRIGDKVLSGKIVFEESDTIKPELTQRTGTPVEYTLSLNVTSTSSSSDRSIREIIVMQSQGTIFGVEQYNANSIEVSLGAISRDDICENAHREDSIDIYDFCEQVPPTPGHAPVIPAQSDSFWVFDISKLDGQTSNTTMRQAFNIVAPNLNLDGIVNPVNVQMVNGSVKSNPPKFTRTMSDAEAAVQMKKITASNVVGNGIILQIPGLQ